MALFGEILAAMQTACRRAMVIGGFALRELWLLCAAWMKETCIIIGCLAALYLTRTVWDMARVALPLWQQGTFGAVSRSFLAAVALLVEGFVNLVCSSLVHCMVLVLLIQGSRVPFQACAFFLGKRTALKRLLVSVSLLLSSCILVMYYSGADHVFARGIALRRSGLFDAVARNDTVRVVAELLHRKHVEDDPVGWPFDYSALHEASRRGHTNMVALLLDAGANMSRKTAFGDTALMLASCNGHLEVVQLLMARGANPNDVNAFGDSSLLMASYHGHEELAKTLLDAGASAEIVNTYGDRAYTLAVRQRHEGLVQILHMHSRRSTGRKLIRDMLSKLAHKLMAPVQVVVRPVHKLVRSFSQSIGRLCRFFLRAAFSLSPPEELRATLIFRLYLDSSDLEGPCSAFSTDSWLHFFGYRDVVCVDRFCQQCAAQVPYLHHVCLTCGVWFWQQFDSDFRSLFDARVKSDKVDMCREAVLVVCWFSLALYGFVCDFLDLVASWRESASRERALYLAARHFELDEVQRLLALGVRPDRYRDPRELGATALIAAACHGHAQVVREFLDAGASVDEPDDLGRTPLMHAALQGHADVALELIDAGASLEARDIFSNTAVMACFSRFFVGFVWDVDFAGRNRETARVLIEAGADVHVEDGVGISVLTWAWINLHLEVALDAVIPHHAYHASMYDMLQQHIIAALSALRKEDPRVCSAPAA